MFNLELYVPVSTQSNQTTQHLRSAILSKREKLKLNQSQLESKTKFEEIIFEKEKEIEGKEEEASHRQINLLAEEEKIQSELARLSEQIDGTGSETGSETGSGISLDGFEKTDDEDGKERPRSEAKKGLLVKMFMLSNAPFVSPLNIKKSFRKLISHAVKCCNSRANHIPLFELLTFENSLKINF